jgi:hypothetical protein
LKNDELKQYIVSSNDIDFQTLINRIQDDKYNRNKMGTRFLISIVIFMALFIISIFSINVILFGISIISIITTFLITIIWAKLKCDNNILDREYFAYCLYKFGDCLRKYHDPSLPNTEKIEILSETWIHLENARFILSQTQKNEPFYYSPVDITIKCMSIFLSNPKYFKNKETLKQVPLEIIDWFIGHAKEFSGIYAPDALIYSLYNLESMYMKKIDIINKEESFPLSVYLRNIKLMAVIKSTLGAIFFGISLYYLVSENSIWLRIIPISLTVFVIIYTASTSNLLKKE